MLKDLADFSLIPSFPLSVEQQAGCRFLLERKYAVLNFQAGLGKTILSLTAAIHIMRYRPNAWKTVVLCPGEANDAFRNELAKFKMPYCLYEASGITGDRNSDVHIFNFSSMDRFVPDIKKLSDTHKIVALIDEAHALQHRTSKQFVTFKALRKLFTVCYALTATPLMSISNIKGMYNLIDYLSPGFLGSWASFRNGHLIWHLDTIHAGGRSIRQEEITGIKDIAKLKELISQILIVRGREYDIRYHYHKTKLSPSEMTYYKQAGHGILHDSERSDFASRLHDLQRVVDWSHESLPESLKSKVSSKEKLFLKVLQGILDQKLSVLVYSEYHDSIDRLESLIGRASSAGILSYSRLFRITGKETKAVRSQVEVDLEPGSIVLCTQSGSQSRNLQKASQVIVYNIPFSVGRLIQLVGRVARMNSTYDHQDIHIIEAEDTIDSYKCALAKDSAWLYNKLFGGNSNLPDYAKMDRTALKDVRKKLLWGFSQPIPRLKIQL